MNKLMKKVLLLMIVMFTPGLALAARTGIKPDLDRIWRQDWDLAARYEPSIRFPYQACFEEAAAANTIPLPILLAVARGESNFKPRAKSDKNCHGIMQIRWPGTAKHLGITRFSDLYDPCTNIKAGAGYLRELLDRYKGNVHLALAAYNYGPTRIGKNPSAAGLPSGAKWYSSYIHHHLDYVLNRSPASRTDQAGLEYADEGTKQVIVFNRPYRAQAFYAYLQDKAPELRLDWFQLGLGRFEVVLLYAGEQELAQGRQALKRLGYTLHQP